MSRHVTAAALVLLALAGATAELEAQQLACDDVRRAFPRATLEHLSIEYDAEHDRRTIASKGLDLGAAILTGSRDWVYHSVRLVGEAPGPSGVPSAYVLRYDVSQAFGLWSTMHYRPPLPWLWDDTALLVSTGSARFVLAPASHTVLVEHPVGLWEDAMPGFVRETAVYPLTAEQLVLLAHAAKVTIVTSDERMVRVQSPKVIRGARAILLGNACGWPTPDAR